MHLGASLGVLNCQSISFPRKPIAASTSFCLGTQGYGSKYWLTYNQAAKLGGNVKRGEKSSLVTFWNIGEEKKIRRSDGTERLSKPILLRYYSVFNLDQTEGTRQQTWTVFHGSRCRHGGVRANRCRNAEVRHSANSLTAHGIGLQRTWLGCLQRLRLLAPKSITPTLFHELTHSTGHKSRVGRDGIEHLNTFGSESYSKEELDRRNGCRDALRSNGHFSHRD